jgi:hypothetical protein
MTSISKTIQNFILNLDIVGSKIELTHNKSSTIKSYIGSLISTTIVIFFLYSIIYFGSDLIYKEKPISRFSKMYDNSSRIYFKDYPYRISTTDLSGFPINATSYMSLRVAYHWFSMEGQPYHVQNTGLMEPCQDDFYPKELKPLFDAGSDAFYKNSFCLNPFKYIASNGTLVQDDVFIQNAILAQNSSALTIYVEPCVNTTENGNFCLPLDEQLQKINSVQLTSSYLDSYINLNDYGTPSTYVLSSLTLIVTTNIRKTHFLTVRKANINTDSGLIMEDISESSTIQVGDIRTDLNNENFYYQIVFVGENIADNYFRRYIKLQDIIASIGGLLKFLLTLASLALNYFVKLNLRLDLLNTFYDLKLVPLSHQVGVEKSMLKEVSGLDISNLRDLKDIKKDNFVNTNNVNNALEIVNIKASLKDYLKGVLGCRSKYEGKLYKQFKDLITSKFEIMNFIKDSISIDNLIEILCDKQQKDIVTGKRFIIPEKLGSEINYKFIKCEGK